MQIFWQDAPKTEAAAPAEPAAAPATVNGDAESDPAKRKPKTSSVSVISVVVSDQVLASSRALSLSPCVFVLGESVTHMSVFDTMRLICCRMRQPSSIARSSDSRRSPT